ncbi:MAG: hypothetical protein ACRECH_13215, partial [Nitrososphaerales archaeon]
MGCRINLRAYLKHKKWSIFVLLVIWVSITGGSAIAILTGACDSGGAQSCALTGGVFLYSFIFAPVLVAFSVFLVLRSSPIELKIGESVVGEQGGLHLIWIDKKRREHSEIARAARMTGIDVLSIKFVSKSINVKFEDPDEASKIVDAISPNPENYSSCEIEARAYNMLEFLLLGCLGLVYLVLGVVEREYLIVLISVPFFLVIMLVSLVYSFLHHKSYS